VRRWLVVPLSASVLLAASSVGARAAQLASPFAAHVDHFGPAAQLAVTPSCPVPPAVEHSVTAIAFDMTKSPISGAAKERLSGPYVEYGRNFIAAVDQLTSEAAVGGDAAAGTCALSWLTDWAAGHALEGKVNAQGRYERMWRLTGLALVYMELHDTGLVSARQGHPVVAWLMRLMRRVEPDYGNPANVDAHNNHAYWAACGIAAIGIATNNRALFNWGMARYRAGADAVTSDGILPAEMRRGRRALHNHLFALTPLVMLAEMGEANGLDTYGFNHGALRRLVARTLYGVRNPEWFTWRARARQDIGWHYQFNSDEIAWSEPYEARFHSTALRPILRAYRPIFDWRDGGDLTGVYARTRR
jgi:poly(beta-D-mannuronate) lyase